MPEWCLPSFRDLKLCGRISPIITEHLTNLLTNKEMITNFSIIFTEGHEKV